MPSHTIRFGPFHLDVRAAELHQDGIKMKLPEQPFLVLAELVEHPGEVVTREELRTRLWQSDTFVDFEQGLNAAVKRLRELLGDSADNPRYIETLPRHGYRLMVPVEPVGPAADVVSQPSRWRRAAWLAVSLLLVAVAIGGFLWQQHRSNRPHFVKIEALAVMPLENLSGSREDEYFADSMTEALITEMGKLSTLRVISHQSMMQYRDSNKTVPQIARELHVDAVVEGSVFHSGNKVRISVQLIQADPERHLWSESYERDVRDLIAFQREVSQAIVQQIQARSQ